MPNTVIVKQGQCLFDIAMQTTGSAESVFELASLNNLSITDDLIPGTVLTTPDVSDGKIVDYYNSEKITPASA